MSIIQKQLVRHAMMVRAVAVGIVAVLLILLGLIPMIGKMNTLTKKVASRAKEAKEITERVAILEGIDKEILRKRVEILDKALPNKKDVLLYLSTIDSLSKELGLNFSGISLAPGDVAEASASAAADGRKTKTVADEVPGVHSLETEVKITGKRENIFAFLRAIEQALPLMQVKDVKISILGSEDLALSLRLGMLWAKGDISNVKGAITLFNEKEESYFQQLSSYIVYAKVPLNQELNADQKNKVDIFSQTAINEIPTTEVQTNATETARLQP